MGVPSAKSQMEMGGGEEGETEQTVASGVSRVCSEGDCWVRGRVWVCTHGYK